MDNRIRETRVFDARLDPAEAQIWITISPERLTSTTQVVGRLMGPRCRYASTVEVAYPLREQSREYETTGTPRLISRVIIPEPNFWEPETPFLYEGPVELWQGGQRCDKVQVTHALRTFSLGPRGLRLNGRPFTIRGKVCASCTEDQANRWHQDGTNTLLAPVSAAAAGLGEIGDRFGFFVLGHITAREQLAHTSPLAKHPCFLGWLITPDLFRWFPFDEDPSLVTAILPMPPSATQTILGMEFTRPPEQVSLLEDLSFIACPEELLPSVEGIPLPKLLLGRPGDKGHGGERAAPPPPGWLGWVEATR